MNLLGAKINEAPDGLRNGLRALINVGSFVKSVLDHADSNARAKVEMGQEPDLLEDVMAGGNVHIPQLEDLVAEFAGRTAATKMVDFMMQTHNVIGLLDDLLASAKHGDLADPQPHPPGSRGARPAPAAQGAATHDSRPPPSRAANGTFRPEFTTAADPAAQRAAQRGITTELDIGPASPQASAPPRTHNAPRKTTALHTFKLEVARHLYTFEQAVAEEQADLRRRIIGANSEAAGLRADVRLLESERAKWAEGAPRIASAPPPPDQAARPAGRPPDPAPPRPTVADAPDASPGAETPVDHGTANDDDDIAEEEAAEFLEMLSASQQRIRASLARDRELVEALGSDLHDIRQQVTRLQAPM